MKWVSFSLLLIIIIGIQLLLCWGHVYIWGHWTWLYYIPGSLWIGTLIISLFIGGVSSIISEKVPLLRIIGVASSAIISGIAACLADLITFESNFGEWLFIVLIVVFAAFIGGTTAITGVTKAISAFASSD